MNSKVLKHIHELLLQLQHDAHEIVDTNDDAKVLRESILGFVPSARLVCDRATRWDIEESMWPNPSPRPS